MEVGVDIVDIRKISKMLKKKKFIERVFSEDEIRYCSSKKNSTQHYAVRFAAKEAVLKILGKNGISIKNINVINDSSGKPRIVFNKLKKIEKKFSISLSHSGDYAVAVAVFNE